MSKQIYTVFACDEWKGKDSMRLLMATTSVRKLKSFIVRKIADETFSYGKGVGFSILQQVKQFKNDFSMAEMPVAGFRFGEINTHLDYGYIECCCDGEEI